MTSSETRYEIESYRCIAKIHVQISTPKDNAKD